MKILFLSPAVPPAINGVGDYTWHLVRELRKTGEDARILTQTNQPATEAWIHPLVSRWTGRETAQAVQSLKEFKPDWCCLQFVSQLYGKAGICLPSTDIPKTLQRLGCKTLVTFHEVAVPFEWNFKRAVLSAVTHYQAQRLLEGAGCAVATCESNAVRIKRLAPGVSVKVIPVGNNIPFAPLSAENKRGLRARYFDPACTVFGIFGRLTAERDFQILPRLLAKAKAQGMEAGLLMIGCVESSNTKSYSQLMEEAERLGVRDRIQSTGELPAEEVSRHLQITDVFVFPQLSGVSTRNTTFMAALAHNLPVVVYAPQSGHFEGHQIPCGAQVARQDEQAFIQAALDLAKQLREQPDEGCANEEYFRHHFSWDCLRDQYLDIFSQIPAALRG